MQTGGAPQSIQIIAGDTPEQRQRAFRKQLTQALQSRGNQKIRFAIEPGFGMDGSLSVEDNLRLLGQIQGLSGGQIDDVMLSVLAFAGFENADAKVHTLSSGQLARLSLALALHGPADQIFLGEIWSLVDAEFTRSCMERIQLIQREQPQLQWITQGELACV